MLLLPGLMMLCLLVGCATIPKEEDMKGSLRTVAEEYWKHRMEDKYDATYKMEDERELLPYERYRDLAMRMKKIEIVSHSVKGVSVSGDKGAVIVHFDIKLPNIPKPLPQILNDSWVYRDGKWRHTGTSPELRE